MIEGENNQRLLIGFDGHTNKRRRIVWKVNAQALNDRSKGQADKDIIKEIQKNISTYNFSCRVHVEACRLTAAFLHAPAIVFRSDRGSCGYHIGMLQATLNNRCIIVCLYG